MNPVLLDLPVPIWTPRLCIKPRFAGEGPVLNRVICSSLEHLKPWMPFAQRAPTLEESEDHCRRSVAKFILREDFTFSIYLRDGKTFVGSTGFHQPNWELRSFHIGYWVSAEFAGKGYISESTNALTRYGFEVLKARRLEIRCDERNENSFGVMDRLGYAREGVLKNGDLDTEGVPRNTIVTARCDLVGLSPLDVSW